MATLTDLNKQAIWTVKEYSPDIFKSETEAEEIKKFESSVILLETQIKLSRNPKDIAYLNNLLVYTNYAICTLKYQNY